MQIAERRASDIISTGERRIRAIDYSQACSFLGRLDPTYDRARICA